MKNCRWFSAGVLQTVLVRLGFAMLVLCVSSMNSLAQLDTVIVPYLATGYKYQQVSAGTGAGFEAPGFDDASWLTGQAGFGNIAAGCPLNNSTYVKTAWSPLTDILIRRHISLPAGAGLRVSAAIDNDIQVFINGHDVSGGLRTHEGCAVRGSFVFTVPNNILNVGDNVVAVRGHDRGVDCYLDIQITADLPQVYLVTDTFDGEGGPASSGISSLRDAINDANTTLGVDTIKFNLPGSGVQTFFLNFPLPDITDPIVIDGYTQPGASRNTLATGSNATLLIEIQPSSGMGATWEQRPGKKTITGFWDGLVVTGGNSTISGMVINSFPGAGIALLSSNNHVEGNFIGTDATGTSDWGNNVDGVFIGNGDGIGSNNHIGGNTPAARNLISGNNRNGMTFDQVAGTIVEGNYIGTNAAGTAALGNSEAGIGIFIGSNHTIGGPTSSSRNVISGNGYSGVEVNSASGGTIANNYIGTNASGTASIENGESGVFSFNGSEHITIGGEGTGNLLSGNNYEGVWIRDGSNCTVSGNYIGVNAAATSALANGGDGIVVGDFGALLANKNSQQDKGRNRRVTLPSISTGTGILAAGGGAADSIVVGGASVASRNVISGNDGAGVYFVASSNSIVAGNYIGVNAAGAAAMENDGDGVTIGWYSSNITVGPNNVISGNTGAGVGIFNSSENAVQGNHIGTDATGAVDLGNQLDGVIVDITTEAGASSNSIGGIVPGAGNVIAFNGQNGVRIADGDENAVLGNSIFSNGLLGIDLEGDGVTPNHTGFEFGANNHQNYPVIAFAAFDLQGIAGFIHSAPLTTYRIELFRNPTADPSGFGEGQTLLTTVSVTTDSTGLGTFYVDVPGQLTQGQFVTATATDPDNNTSEFSAATIVNAKVKVFGDHFVVNTTLSGIPLHWDEGNAIFRVSTNVPVPYRAPIIDGYDSWSNLPQVLYSYGGTTDTTTWGGDPDGVNNNVWVTSGWEALTGADSNTIAVTRVRYNTLTGEITDADIAFDAEHFPWDETGTVPTAMDIQNTATHEIGHFGGLGDIYEPGNPGYVPQMGSGNLNVTMFGLIARGETSKRSLDTPDSAGIGYIYSNIPASRMDLMLVFDGSSGFATTFNGFEPAKNSSMELVERLRNGDRIGVVKMPGTVVFPLTAMVDSATRAQARAAINSLASGGTSSIGSGLQTAQAQLALSPLPDHGKAMILFSAGEETGAPGALSVLPPIIAANTNVFTLGFQGSGGQTLANKIADSTGGSYYLAADTTIQPIVNQIWNQLTGQQQTFYTVAPSDTFRNVPQPGLQWQGPVDRGTTSILPGIQWQGPKSATFASPGVVPPSSFVLSLMAPGSTTLIDSAYVAAHPELGIQFFSGPTFQFFKINNPIPGLWTLFAYGRTVPDLNEPVVLSITAFTDITMAVATDQIAYQPDQVIQMSVALSEGGESSGDPHVTGGGPITDAIVVVKVKPPDPDSVHTVALNHIGAGVYTGSFGNTHVPGTYGLTFTANKDTIERTATEAVFVVPPPPSNLIVNPGFEAGTSPWIFYTAGSGTFVIGGPAASGAGAAKVTVNNPGSNTQLYQGDITLEQNAQYRLTFKAYSSTGHNLSVFVHRNTTPFTNYGLNGQVFDLGTSWQTFTTVFTAVNFPPPNPSNARVRFKLNGFATAGDKYFIDDVVLEKVSGGPPVATKINVETAADGTGSIVPAQTIAGGGTITVYAISRDASNTFVANVSAAWTLQSITGGVVAGDLIASGDGKSATFTGAADGSAEIKATSGLLAPTPSGKITVFTPPPPTNFIANGGFESGAANWTFSTNGTGKFTIVSPGNVGAKAAQIGITVSGTVVQLFQSAITLTAGQTYKLSFKAFSNTGHDVQASIFKHASPFTPYGLPLTTFNLTNGWATYSVNFTASGFGGTVNDARLRFWLSPYDAFGDLYFFDDVKLEYAPIPPDAGELAETEAVPATFSLRTNFPNPFNPSTTIVYELPVDAHVSLEVFNLLGQRVAQLVDGTISAGYHDAVFNAGDLASGMYFYRLTAAGSEGVLFSRTEKMMLTK